MYKCSDCNKTCVVPGYQEVVGSPVPGAKLFHIQGATCYHACPYCNKIHFYGMEKVNARRA